MNKIAVLQKLTNQAIDLAGNVGAVLAFAWALLWALGCYAGLTPCTGATRHAAAKQKGMRVGNPRGAQSRHRSFILRIWQAGNGRAPEWRCSLENAQTRERRGFASVGALLAFLETQLPRAGLAEEREEPMTLVDLSQGEWRFHTALGLMSKDELFLHPAQPNGPNSDVVLALHAHAENHELAEGLALAAPWFEAVISRKEDPWDTPASKGEIRIKVFPASASAHPSQQVIQIYQTNYEWSENLHTGDLTIYTGRLYQPEGQPDAPPVFFGYGADNAGRQWLTFSLAPSDVRA